jgi:hypothetical protein
MSLIDELKRRPVAAGIIAVCLVTALVMTLSATRGRVADPVPVKKMFVYDEATKTEGVRNSDEVPPLLNDKGEPTVMRAYYASPDGGATKVLVYLEKFDDNAKAAYKAYMRDPGGERGSALERQLQAGRFVRAAQDGSPWVPYDSAEGRAVIGNTRGANGQQMSMVFP